MLCLVACGACSSGRDEPHGGGGAAGTAGATGGSAGRGSGGAGGDGASGSGGAAGTQMNGGTGGEGGAAGSAGSAGSSGASGGQGGEGDAPMTDDPACEPASITFADDWRDAASNCPSNEAFYGIESRVPNPGGGTFMNEIALAAPIASGSLAAISMVLDADSTSGNLEIWGSDSAEVCGPVDELLWYGLIESRRLCAEFTPSQTTSWLRLVWRQLEVLQGSFSGNIRDVALCPAGSCLGATSGVGRTTEAISAPVGVYEVGGAGGLPFASGFAWSIGGRGAGAMIGTWGDPVEDPMVHPISRGIVRLPPHDPFGDGWYCIGEGSAHLVTPDSEDSADTVQLRNLTRLPDCASGSGSASITDSDDVAQITTAIAGHAMIDADAMGSSCQGRNCEFSFRDLGDGSDYRTVVLILRTAEDVYYNAAPTLVTSDITEAFWVLVRADETIELSCASGGSIHFDPVGETTISLTGIGAPLPACPGETVDPSTLDIFID